MEITSEKNLEQENIPQKDKPPCANCIIWSKQIQDLKDSITDLKSFIKGELKEEINHQNGVVMETLAEHTVLIEKLLFQEREVSALGDIFPIMDDNQLKTLNENINDSNKNIYINIVKKIVRNKLTKNIDLIFDPLLIYEYNIEGSHGKKGLKDMKNVYEIIKDAASSIYGLEEGEEKLRKAIQLSKKRQLKKKTMANKSMESSN